MSVCGARPIEKDLWVQLDAEERLAFPPCQNRPEHPGRHDWERPDELVHDAIEVRRDGGSRIVTVKCGRPLPRMASYEPLAGSGATCWPSLVTCPACLVVAGRKLVAA